MSDLNRASTDTGCSGRQERADWLVFGVAFEPSRRQIALLMAYPNGKIDEAVEVLTRATAIEMMEAGATFYTIFNGATGWNRGVKLSAISIGEHKYIRPSGDPDECDTIYGSSAR